MPWSEHWEAPKEKSMRFENSKRNYNSRTSEQGMRLKKNAESRKGLSATVNTYWPTALASKNALERYTLQRLFTRTTLSFQWALMIKDPRVTARECPAAEWLREQTTT
jgi:hypothetical protein